MSAEWVLAVAAIAQIAVTAVLAWVLARSTNKIARLDFDRSVRDAWVTVDELALANDDTLHIADALLTQPRQRTDGFARKRWFTLAYLNPIATMWQAAKEGNYGSNSAQMQEVVREMLAVILVDDDVYWVTQNHGHEASFRRFCTEVRDAVKKGPAAPQVPPTRKNISA